MNKNLVGTGVALVTPFDDELNIDYGALKKLLLFQAEQGADYFVVNGTTGESPTTSTQEKADLLAFVKEHSQGLPIVCGIGGNNTLQIIENIKNTNLEGVEAILSVSPYYNKPTQKGIEQHYIKIADESPLPILLYNVPGRTNANITFDTTIKLSKHQNIIGIKEASCDFEQCMNIAYNTPDDFLLISGVDIHTVPMISVGAVGAISVLANAYPARFKTLMNEALAGNYKTANEAAFPLLAIDPLMYDESSPTGIKKVLEIMGYCKEYVRMPLAQASDELVKKIEEQVEKLK